MNMHNKKTDKNANMYGNRTIDVNKSAVLTAKYSEI